MSKLIDGKSHNKESIVRDYKNLVYFLANRLAGAYEAEDLTSEGYIALMDAFDKYEDGHGIRFSTFARHRIHQHLLRVMRKPATGPYYPHGIVTLSWKIVRENLEDLSAVEISERLDEPFPHVERALAYLYTRHPAKLDSTVPGTEKETTLHELIGRNDDFSDVFVKDFIASLTDVERIVVHGLQSKMSQRQIAEIVGYSQYHVSRILRRIREKFKQYDLAGVV